MRPVLSALKVEPAEEVKARIEATGYHVMEGSLLVEG